MRTRSQTKTVHGLNYDHLTAPIVNAIQELNTWIHGEFKKVEDTIAKLTSRQDVQQKQIDTQQKEIDQLKYEITHPKR